MKLPFKENLILIAAILIFLFLEFGTIAQIETDNIFLASLFGEWIKISTPNGNEEWKTGQSYQINWSSTRGIDKVGIVLFKGEKPSWIAKDISVKEGQYSWDIPNWLEPSSDYKIAIFEYPWRKGSKIAYSKSFFTIVGPKYGSCDALSLKAEFPFFSSDFPNLRKVFITHQQWTGNLGSLKEADSKCQKEAEKEGFSGNWQALLGDDRTSAVERLKLDGIFVEANIAATLPEGKTCHRLLGENLDKFLEKFSNLWLVNREKLSDEFINRLKSVWLGRINDKSKKDCVIISTDYPSRVLAENYSFTTTCQNWTEEDEKIKGYPPIANYKPEYPKCYTSSAKTTDAVGQAGLSAGLTGTGSTSAFNMSLGKPCDTYQNLLCVEQ